MAAKLTTVTQEMNKFKLDLGTVTVRVKEREGLHLGMFQEVAWERHLGTGRFDKTRKPGSTL